VHQMTPRGENRLLLRLPADALSQLKPLLKDIELENGTVLHRPGEPIDYVYFPTSGLVSMFAIMQSGEAIETAVIGKEGVVGGLVGSQGARSFGQAMVQIEGSALRIGAPHFVKLLEENNGVRSLVNRYQSILFLQAQQSAACHAFHSIEARLCRWLLQSADTVESNLVNLTQEFLSHMLGCQRTSVTMAAHALQTSGLIRYTRGKIEILDRPGLEECACECYRVLRREIDDAVPVSLRKPGYGGQVPCDLFHPSGTRRSLHQFGT
jgi:CRP-like cAMP-binding protein